MSTPPHTKYHFEFTVDANSHDEISDAIHALYVNFWQRLDGRDECDITSSDRTTMRLTHTNPEQTPERYDAELREWAAARRKARA
jgi:hypothetical protein